MNGADESDEVADLGVKKTQSWRRIGLRMRRIGKISDRFQADHGGDLVAARFASPGVNKASHFVRQEIGGLLIYKRDEPQRGLRFCGGEAARKRKGCSDTGAVVICAGRAEHRIVVRTDQKNFGISAANFCLYIVAGLPTHLVAVPSRMETGARKRILDKVGSRVELRIMPHVSLADVSSEHLHIATELFTQR